RPPPRRQHWGALEPLAKSKARLKREHHLNNTLAAQCSLWVKSRHSNCNRSCPLYPRKRTCAMQTVMSASGQKQTCAAHGLCPPRAKAEVISRCVGWQIGHWRSRYRVNRGGRRGLRLDPDIIGEAKPTAARSAANLSAPKRGVCRRPAIRSAVNHL